MMTFCRRSVHPFLGLSSINNNITDHNIDKKQPPKCYGGPQGLVTATGDIHRPLNVLQSSSVKSSSSSSSSSSTSPSKKLDPTEIGFFIDKDVDGLTSCTESLGFESSDERRVDDHNNHNDSNDEIELHCPKTTSFSSSSSSSLRFDWRRRRRLERKREKEKKFPPPLSWLYPNGQPNFFLWPVRKDGSLELTEVRIYRPSVFHAYKEDGRLRLHIVRDNIDGEDVKDEDHEEEEEEEERVVSGGEWRFKGVRRCRQDPYSHQNDYHHHHHHHHHNLFGEFS